MLTGFPGKKNGRGFKSIMIMLVFCSIMCMCPYINFCSGIWWFQNCILFCRATTSVSTLLTTVKNCKTGKNTKWFKICVDSMFPRKKGLKRIRSILVLYTLQNAQAARIYKRELFSSTSSRICYCYCASKHKHLNTCMHACICQSSWCFCPSIIMWCVYGVFCGFWLCLLHDPC